MISRKKLFFCVIVVCIVVLFLAVLIPMRPVKQSYYPMGGQGSVVDKAFEDGKYTIVIQQNDSMDGPFVLSCTEDQYHSVEIGDLVICVRQQSVANHDGTVHTIYPLGGEATIVDTSEKEGLYFLHVRQAVPADDGHYATFTLECTKDLFQVVEAGDPVICDRNGNTLLYDGAVYTLNFVEFQCGDRWSS